MTFTVAAATADAGTWPVGITIGGMDVRTAVPLETLNVEESGNQQPGSCSFTVEDPRMAYGGIDNEQLVIVRDNDANREIFRGHVKTVAPTVVAIGRRIRVTATDVAAKLDQVLVQYLNRPAGESDQARLTYLMGIAAGTGLSTASTYISVVKSSMPAQKFRNLTLRGAIEQVAATASPNARYYIDPVGRLHYGATFSTGTAAPYTVRVGNPGATEVAPEGLEITRDSIPLRTGYYVRAKVASASHLVIDTTAQARYGVSRDYVDAPDADTWQKAEDVGRAALADNAYPIPRGSFGVTGDPDGTDYSYRVISGSRRYWEPSQVVTIISAQHGLPSTAPGSAPIVRVSTSFLSGTGVRQLEIEFGGGRMRFTAVNRTLTSSATSLVGQRLTGTVGGTYRDG